MSVFCRGCYSSDYVHKSGFNRAGSQRYRCRRCNHYFTPHPKQNGYGYMKRGEAIGYYEKGYSLRAIARVLKVNHQTVANWVKGRRKLAKARRV